MRRILILMILILMILILMILILMILILMNLDVNGSWCLIFLKQQLFETITYFTHFKAATFRLRLLLLCSCHWY
ncbi:hypothetical protein DSECCO2_559090 [anaerobic digester metagenome]